MGNQQSITNVITDTVNKSVTNVLISNSSHCSQTNAALQSIGISNVRSQEGCTLTISGISQTSVQAPSFDCISQTMNEKELSSQFVTALKQEAKATVEGFPGALNSQAISNTVNKLINDIENNVSISNASSCVVNTLAEQMQEYGNLDLSCPAHCRDPSRNPRRSDSSTCRNTIKDLTQDITQAAVAKCISTNENLSKIIADAANDLEQESESENKGFFDFADIAASIAALGSIWLIPLILCIACVFFSSSSSLSGIMLAGNEDVRKALPNMQQLQQLQQMYNPQMYNPQRGSF